MICYSLLVLAVCAVFCLSAEEGVGEAVTAIDFPVPKPYDSTNPENVINWFELRNLFCGYALLVLQSNENKSLPLSECGPYIPETFINGLTKNEEGLTEMVNYIDFCARMNFKNNESVHCAELYNHFVVKQKFKLGDLMTICDSKSGTALCQRKEMQLDGRLRESFIYMDPDLLDKLRRVGFIDENIFTSIINEADEIYVTDVAVPYLNWFTTKRPNSLILCSIHFLKQLSYLLESAADKDRFYDIAFVKFCTSNKYNNWKNHQFEDLILYRRFNPEKVFNAIENELLNKILLEDKTSTEWTKEQRMELIELLMNQQMKFEGIAAIINGHKKEEYQSIKNALTVSYSDTLADFKTRDFLLSTIPKHFGFIDERDLQAVVDVSVGFYKTFYKPTSE